MIEVANYQTIVRLRPEVRDFIRNRRWVRRGEVLVYGPNTRCESFSTDSAGFRHSVFAGETLSVHDCLQRERYAIVLGSSNLYGFGLAGNENTIPSLLAAKFGFPFANVCLPEANSRNLSALLVGFLARAPKPPSIVLHMSGGDFTGFCYTSMADPVFGSPNAEGRRDVGRPGNQVQRLLAFTALWTRTIARLCRVRKIPLVLGNDTTFFEKAKPSAIELESALGTASRVAQARQFDTHRKFVNAFYERREALAHRLSLPLAGPGRSNTVGFVDEFHYDSEGTRTLAEDFAGAIAPLLR